MRLANLLQLLLLLVVLIESFVNPPIVLVCLFLLLPDVVLFRCGRLFDPLAILYLLNQGCLLLFRQVDSFLPLLHLFVGVEMGQSVLLSFILGLHVRQGGLQLLNGLLLLLDDESDDLLFILGRLGESGGVGAMSGGVGAMGEGGASGGEGYFSDNFGVQGEKALARGHDKINRECRKIRRS